MRVEAVSVEADITPVVTTNTMDKAYVVDRTEMSELPINGRNFTSLMTIVPGMSQRGAKRFCNVDFNDVSQFHSLGGRGSENNMYLDGSPNIDVGDNQSQYTQASVDTIAEFRVLQSGFNAEYGRTSGMVIAVQTKSGASQFHGTAYEYLRNNYFDAKCVQCNTWQPTLRYNQFGGNFSGWVPMPKLSTKADKRLFFFYNREMTRRNLPGSSYADVPNSTILGGNFTPWLLNTNMTYAPQFLNGTVFEPGTVTRDGSGNITGGTPYPNNTVPQSSWQPFSANLPEDLYGNPGYASLAATPGDPGYVRYFFNNPDNSGQEPGHAARRLQHQQQDDQFLPLGERLPERNRRQRNLGLGTFPIQTQARPKPGSSWAWNLVTTFTPTLASETILSYNHQSQSLSVVRHQPARSQYDRRELRPRSSRRPTLPTRFPIHGARRPSASPWATPDGTTGVKTTAATENVSWVKGSHNFKFGVFYNRDDKAQTGSWGMEGSINFNSNATMATGHRQRIGQPDVGQLLELHQPQRRRFPMVPLLGIRRLCPGQLESQQTPDH